MVGARLPASMAWGTPPQQHQCTMARLRGAGRVQCMAAACVCAHVMLAIEGVCSWHSFYEVLVSWHIQCQAWPCHLPLSEHCAILYNVMPNKLRIGDYFFRSTVRDRSEQLENFTTFSRLLSNAQPQWSYTQEVAYDSIKQKYDLTSFTRSAQSTFAFSWLYVVHKRSRRIPLALQVSWLLRRGKLFLNYCTHCLR
jgi:hypothetical protein